MMKCQNLNNMILYFMSYKTQHLIYTLRTSSRDADTPGFVGIISLLAASIADRFVEAETGLDDA